MKPYQAPLHIHVAYHPSHPHGKDWATHLAKWFGGDPEAFALPQADIPIYVWHLDPPAAVPPDIPWNDAELTVLVLLADAELIADDGWRDWAERQAERKRAGDVILTCATHTGFVSLGPSFADEQAIRLFDYASPDEQKEELRLRATQAICRRFRRHRDPEARTSVFISHAKKDGRKDATALHDLLKEREGDYFFDEVRIPTADRFETTIGDAVRSSVVIALLTDRFSSRYWCGWEVQRAKRNGSPLLVVDLLEHGEPVSLSYGGNCRTVRGDPRTFLAGAPDAKGAARDVVAGALLELLRADHNRARLAAVAEAASLEGDFHFSPYPPELAALPPIKKDGPTHILHPDPPLPLFDVELIREQRPDVQTSSLSQAFCNALNRTAGKLRGQRIAVSISDGEDRKELGMTDLQQERLWTLLTTHLLTCGAQLGYGGHLEPGYTLQLVDLVRAAMESNRPFDPNVVHCYLGWPISSALTADDKASLPRMIRLHPLPAPEGVVPIDVIDNPRAAEGGMKKIARWPRNNNKEEHFAWTVGMRAMREKMAEDCAARILLGGKLRSVSPVPGLIDELVTFVKRQKPVYLIGAFGGATRAIIQALLGEKPQKLTTAYLDAGGREEMRLYHDEQVQTGKYPLLRPADFDAIVAELNELGPGSLRNGLSDEENRRLFFTRDPFEMLSLVLLGLKRTFGPGIDSGAA